MNLGRRRITNAELCACFEGLGFQDAAAFLASGNVVFSSEGTPASIRKRVEAGLSEALDYDVPTFVRTVAQVRTIARREPFVDREGKEGRGKPQVVILARKPSASSAAAVLAQETEHDWLEFNGKELHWWPSGRLMDSELDVRAMGKALGPMTIRTRNTIVRLAAKFCAAR